MAKMGRPRNRVAKNRTWKAWYALNKEDYNAKNRARAKKYKLQAFVLLGSKCARCGIADSRVLQIDHVNGGGSREKKEIGHGSCLMYLRVLKTPELFQLLCANCNWIKRVETKECGHIVLEAEVPNV